MLCPELPHPAGASVARWNLCDLSLGLTGARVTLLLVITGVTFAPDGN